MGREFDNLCNAGRGAQDAAMPVWPLSGRNGSKLAILDGPRDSLGDCAMGSPLFYVYGNMMRAGRNDFADRATEETITC